MSEKDFCAFIGSRKVDDEMCREIREKVVEKMLSGFGIVSGGSTGTDHESAKMAVEFCDENELNLSENLKIFLPQSLENYKNGFLKRAENGKADFGDVREMIELLDKISQKDKEILTENPQFETLNEEAFWNRNDQIASFCAEAVAFTKGESRGTNYTVSKIRELGKEVEVLDFTDRDERNIK